MEKKSNEILPGIIIRNYSHFTVNSSLNGKLYINNSFYYPLTEKEYENITIKTKIDENKRYKSNSKVGNVLVYLNDDIIHTEDIYIEVERKTIFSKIKDIFNNIVDKLF